MKGHEKALQWAKHDLSSNRKIDILNHQVVVETSYSIVYKIETSQGAVYLKQVPAPLFLELRVLRFLHDSNCKNIPEVLSDNPGLNCFITRSCGETSLRHLFHGKINFDMLKQGITHYTSIQRQLETQIESLLAIGVPDWRFHRLPELYQKLIQNEQLLIEDGLTEKEIHHLQHLATTCTELAEKISQYNIPDTIDHRDFHENNMVLDEKTGSINIVDWGEGVISHPFFSLNTCLWNLTYFYEGIESDPRYHQLQSHCVKPWLNLYDEATLLKILGTANKLLGVYAALDYERLYQMTRNQSKTVQHEHPGSIAGCLRTFLKLATS